MTEIKSVPREDCKREGVHPCHHDSKPNYLWGDRVSWFDVSFLDVFSLSSGLHELPYFPVVLFVSSYTFQRCP